jgi:hypothetical protein
MYRHPYAFPLAAIMPHPKIDSTGLCTLENIRCDALSLSAGKLQIRPEARGIGSRGNCRIAIAVRPDGRDN